MLRNEELPVAEDDKGRRSLLETVKAPLIFSFAMGFVAGFVTLITSSGGTDNPARLALRPRHREILTELHDGGEVVLAGPFDDGSGSMVVFTTSRDRVDEVLAADPYYAAEGVTVASIRDLTSLFG